MKGNLIGPDNQKFEADIVRYFQNVNDKYLIYSKGEKDNNGFILLYATKVLSDNGIKIGENITDENEWSLIKNFLKQTVNENKENKPLSIVDINPIEVNDLKLNASRPFKLQENAVELFGKNKKSFEIVQQMLERENTAIPVAPEVTEFVNNDEETNSADINTISVQKPTIEPIISTEPAIESTMPTENIQSNDIPVENIPETKVEPLPEQTNNFEEMYNKELEKNNELIKEMEQLIKDNAELKAKMDKLKELLS